MFGNKDTPRLVGAINEESSKALAFPMNQYVTPTVSVFYTRVAEAAKLLENTFV